MDIKQTMNFIIIWLSLSKTRRLHLQTSFTINNLSFLSSFVSEKGNDCSLKGEPNAKTNLLLFESVGIVNLLCEVFLKIKVKLH